MKKLLLSFVIASLFTSAYALETKESIIQNQKNIAIANKNSTHIKFLNNPDYINLLKNIDTLKKMADSGNSESQTLLGQIYLRGHSGKKDEDLGAKYLRMAVSQNNLDAKLALANLYLKPETFYYNRREAIKLLTEASEQNHKGSQLVLGILYYEGTVGPQNYELASKWLTSGVNNPTNTGYDDDLEPLKQCALHYLGMSNLNMQKYGLAAYYFQILSNQKNPSAVAQYNLGSLYYNGQSVPMNKKYAFILFKNSLKGMENHPTLSHIQYLIGMMSHHGLGTSEDYSEAVKYLKAGSANGSPLARDELAQMYLQGHGVNKNKVLGLALLMLTTQSSQFYVRDETMINMPPEKAGLARNISEQMKNTKNIPSVLSKYEYVN